MSERGHGWDKDRGEGQLPRGRAPTHPRVLGRALWGCKAGQHVGEANPVAPWGNPKMQRPWEDRHLPGDTEVLTASRSPHRDTNTMRPFCLHLCNTFSASFQEETASPLPPPPQHIPRNPPVRLPIASIWQRPGADCRLLKEKALCASAGWKRRRFNNSALFSRNSSAEIPSPHVGENKRLSCLQSDAAAHGCGGEGDTDGTLPAEKQAAPGPS